MFVSIVSTKVPFKGTSKEYIGEDVTEMNEAVKKALTTCCSQLKVRCQRRRASGSRARNGWPTADSKRERRLVARERGGRGGTRRMQPLREIACAREDVWRMRMQPLRGGTVAPEIASPFRQRWRGVSSGFPSLHGALDAFETNLRATAVTHRRLEVALAKRDAGKAQRDRKKHLTK